MGEEILQYKKGDVLVLEEGYLSEECKIVGFIVAQKNLDLPKLAQEFSNGKDRWTCGMSYDVFLEWLISSGYATPIEPSHVILGDLTGWASDFGVMYKED